MTGIVTDIENPQARESSSKRMNFVFRCISNGDLSRLQECFTNEQDPYFGLVEGKLNSFDEDGRTPTEASCIMGDADMVRFLLVKGANPNVRNKQSGKSALDMACILGREQIVKDLLENGAEIDLASPRGYTALHHAAAWGRLQCLKILVEFGAILSVLTTYGEKARDVALRYKHDDCAYYLDWSEAKRGLLAVIGNMKETIEDPQKLQGKLSKDEKMTVINLCSEKQEWLDTADHATIEAIIKNKEQLIEALEPIQQKLLEPAPEKPHRR
ncbi:ankyrin repeat domain-containing protein 45-like [Anneissia japonica]|uniref:ankyrin repeat domain-containing protein 45-like n=1 Tax=Anneissia japonica TaxID=1529436 RepID=UPI0014255FD3|nr:ankyrin repeat domain-containing protein 45-like [Anneissia japonica]